MDPRLHDAYSVEHRTPWWVTIIAVLWLALGIFLNRRWIGSFCGDVISCDVLLYSLSLFLWSALGFAGGLIIHYWKKQPRR